MADLTSVLNQLEQERTRLTSHIRPQPRARRSERDKQERNPHDVRLRTQTHRCGSESTLGEVAEGAEEVLTQLVGQG